MKNNKLLNLLESVFGKSNYKSGDYYYFYSPFKRHHKQKLAININTVNGKNIWKCFISPNSGKRLTSLFNKVSVDSSTKKELYSILNLNLRNYDEYVENNIKLELPKEYKPLYVDRKLDLNYKRALDYLLNVRKISRDDIYKYRIGYCDSGDFSEMIIFPSFDKNCNLNFYTGRTYTNNNYKFKIPKGIKRNFIGFESFINWNLPVVITEAALDAIAIKRNAIPLFGKTINDKIKEKIIENECDVYLCLDDEGILNSLKYAEYFLNEGLNVYVVELDSKDPSDLGYEKIQSKLKSTKKIDKKELFKLNLKYKC